MAADVLAQAGVNRSVNRGVVVCGIAVIVVLDPHEIDLSQFAPRLTAVGGIRLPRAFALAVIPSRCAPHMEDDPAIRSDIEIRLERIVAVKRNGEPGDRRSIERVIRVGPVLTAVVGEAHMNHTVRPGVSRCSAIAKHQRTRRGPLHGRPAKPTPFLPGDQAGFKITDFERLPGRSG